MIIFYSFLNLKYWIESFFIADKALVESPLLKQIKHQTQKRSTQWEQILSSKTESNLVW